MKKVLLLVLLLTLSVNIKAQRIQYDKYVRRQLQSMVFMRWGNFKPRWYYFLKHNKYRKGEDRRTMLQLAPAIVAVEISRQQSKQEKDDGEEWWRQEISIEANIQSEVHYHLRYKKSLDRLCSSIETLIRQAESYGPPTELMLQLNQEYVRLKDHINVIRQGNLMPGDAAEALHMTEGELAQFHARLQKFVAFQKIHHKYEQP